MGTGKVCEMCGGPLPPEANSRRLFCDTCRRQRARQGEEEHRSLRNIQKAREKHKIPPKEPVKSLSQMAKEAHELKLTYGQYSALIASGGLKQYCKLHGLRCPK